MEQQEKNFKNLKNRKFTAYAIILVALALAIAIPINLLASRLNIIWDMTPAKLYELSDTTKNYLETLDKQVDFYFLMDMDYLATDDNSMALYYS
ncbi:MAG: GldG family protein, partial [Oscillospiraceae bacterium]|nr:GldG family protein [Oscillospiraceae bacterium]